MNSDYATCQWDRLPTERLNLRHHRLVYMVLGFPIVARYARLIGFVGESGLQKVGAWESSRATLLSCGYLDDTAILRRHAIKIQIWRTLQSTICA
nr:hypothetical protein CFP56_00928 [Quercus suber]